MEDLIEEFLEELIDKNEITANERTDMKLTLLEAMPREMTEETKTRVMSSLKSKMETPSANIFTDKGVNIDAVRTIANESVKEVVKAVEKEEQAKVEAEAKRDAKVSEAIDSIILDADKKSEEYQNNTDKIIESDDGEIFKDPFFYEFSEKVLESSIEEIIEELGEDADPGKIAFHSQVRASNKSFNADVEALINEGKKPEEAVAIVEERFSRGDPKLKEAQAKARGLDTHILFRTLVTKEIEKGNGKVGFYDAVAIVLENNAKEFCGFLGLNEYIVELYNVYKRKNLTDKQLGVANLKDENVAKSRLEGLIFRKIGDGISFFEAADWVKKYYAVEFRDFEIDALISRIKDEYHEVGLTDEKLKTVLTHEEIENAFVEASEKAQTENEGKKASPSKNGRLIKLPNKNQSFYHVSSEKNVVVGIQVDGVDYHAISEVDKELNESEREKIEQDYGLLTEKPVNEITRDVNTVFVNVLLYKNVNFLYAKQKEKYDKIRELDKKEMDEGKLSARRKNIIQQRSRFVKKFSELYLTGEKSVYEIYKENREYCDKFEILPNDIIEFVTNSVSKNNPKLAQNIKQNEKNLVEREMRLEAAHQLMEKAIRNNNVAEIIEIERHIDKIELFVGKYKKQSIEYKKENQTLNTEKASEIENKLEQSLKGALDYTKEFEKLKMMNNVYSEIYKNAKEHGTTMNNYAIREFFPKNMITANVFGPDLLNALERIKNGENINLKSVIDSCIVKENKRYIETVRQSLAIVNDNVNQNKNSGSLYNGYIEDLIEKDKLERELYNAKIRDSAFERKVSSETSNQILERKEATNKGVIEFFTSNKSLSEICNELKQNGNNIDISDLISKIKGIGNKVGIDKDELKKILEDQMEIHRNNIRIKGTKQLRVNALKTMNVDNISEMQLSIQECERENERLKLNEKGFKEEILLRDPNLVENVRKSQFYAHLSGLQLKNRVDENGERVKFTGKKLRRTRAAGEETKNQQTQEELPKKGIGMMNVAKILETSGTTSQEIVGEVTDLNKIARVQDERGISEEQRDS